MKTNNSYKIDLSNETQESLLNIAKQLCDKYRPSQLITIEAADFQKLMEGSKALIKIEACGDTLDEILSSVGPITADKAMFLVNAMDDYKLTADEMTIFTSYIEMQPENFELCWSIGKTTIAKRQVIIFYPE